jgi:hypothetical protein
LNRFKVCALFRIQGGAAGLRAFVRDEESGESFEHARQRVMDQILDNVSNPILQMSESVPTIARWLPPGRVSDMYALYVAATGEGAASMFASPVPDAWHA